MSPFSNWPIIPKQWAEYHRPAATATMTAPVEIRRSAGPPPYPKPEGWVPYTVIWTGLCRLQELKRENSPVPGLQPTEFRQYLLALPFANSGGTPLPQLRVGEGGDTAAVSGRNFLLKQSMDGSLLWENDFLAWENQTQQNP